MFTVNIKGRRDSKNIELVKLDLIFYKRGYARVSKVLRITGLYREWDRKSQSFIGTDAAEKNKLLRQEKLRYLKIAEKWEYQGKDWIPVELSHYYDDDPRVRNRYITVSETIDTMAERTAARKRYKNGLILTSEPTARKDRYLKTSLERFTRSKYHRDFSKYRFRDITEQFLLDYTLWTQVYGGKKGNNGGIREKLRKLRAVCLYAKETGVYNVNPNAFRPLQEKLKPRLVTPKGVSPEIIRRIETFDRSGLDKKEPFYLDLFLFSYYAGGMSAIDVCLLTRDRIKDDMIVYDRTKFDKQARVILTDKAIGIIDRYRDAAYMNYVFPTIKRCNPTQAKLYGRVKRINEKVNRTLKKICYLSGIGQRVTWSTARSSYISRMIDEGFHPLQVAELAGNSPQTIYRHYYTISDKEKMKEKMDRVFNNG